MTNAELIAAREALGISQAEMALRLTISRHTYMRWESGATKKLPPDLAERIARIAVGKAASVVAAADDYVMLTGGSHPQFYTKQRGGWHVGPNHPLGYSGQIKRKYLDAFNAGGPEAMRALMAQDAPAPAPRATPPQADLAKDPNAYETSGEDDAETERRMANFFAPPT